MASVLVKGNAMFKATLIAIAILIVGLAATATPSSAECKRITDDPASPCRAIQSIDKPVVNYAVAIDGDKCVFSVEWVNPPNTPRHAIAPHAGITLETHYNEYYARSATFHTYHTQTKGYRIVRAYDLASAFKDNIGAPGRDSWHYQHPNAVHPTEATHWHVVISDSANWRGSERHYEDRATYPFDGWTLGKFQTEMFDCAQALEDKLAREAEAARVAAASRELAEQERERELELNRRLLIQVNDLKLAQDKLASEIKLQEKETQVTAEIVAIQKRIIVARIATQEAILSGLERRAEIIRTGALERNAIMQEFLLQSGSRFDAIESKQAEARAAIREAQAAWNEIERKAEAADAENDALLNSNLADLAALRAQQEALKAQMSSE